MAESGPDISAGETEAEPTSTAASVEADIPAEEPEAEPTSTEASLEADIPAWPEARKWTPERGSRLTASIEADAVDPTHQGPGDSEGHAPYAPDEAEQKET